LVPTNVPCSCDNCLKHKPFSCCFKDITNPRYHHVTDKAPKAKDNDDIAAMTVAELKTQLRIRSLAVSGNKSELQERLHLATDEKLTQYLHLYPRRGDVLTSHNSGTVALIVWHLKFQSITSVCPEDIFVLKSLAQSSKAVDDAVTFDLKGTTKRKVHAIFDLTPPLNNRTAPFSSTQQVRMRKKTGAE